ncbi:MAG: VOC family protein [Pseudomonadota bacterium]|jgi:predicted enzyme related to lactoylglutathione lyase|nr:MAG: VOC family protein [Pseudomonadota bacterium]
MVARTPQSSFVWYELMTSDANAAARFYNAVVGWRIPDRPDPQVQGGNDYRMIARSDGGQAGGVLQLTPGMQAGGALPCWLMYLAVPDVDVAVRAIEADGGRKHTRLSLPVGDIAMVTDPAGVPFYVMRPVPPPGRPDAASDVFDRAAAQRVRWHELASADPARARDFYAKHFGFVFTDRFPMGELGEYAVFEDGGVRSGAIAPRPPGAPPGGWLLYFGVTSITAARRAIEAGGGRVLQGPDEIPGGEFSLIAADPQGAHFGVVGPRGD